MRRIAGLSLVVLFLFAPLFGCASCPDGRCASRQVAEAYADDDCSYCGSDGIRPDGFPCSHCDSCAPRLGGCGPLRDCVTGLFRFPGRCSGACGEVYWDEWQNDPPKCDPCVRYGNCRRSHLAELWGTIVGGYCSDEGCAGECGVDDCDGACGDHVMAHDYREHEHDRAPTRAKKGPREPAPAPPLVPADDEQPDQKAQRPRRVIRR